MESDHEGQFQRPLYTSQELEVSYVYGNEEESLDDEQIWGAQVNEVEQDEWPDREALAVTKRLDIYKSLLVSDIQDVETKLEELPEECIIEHEFMLERARIEEALARAANLEIVL